MQKSLILSEIQKQDLINFAKKESPNESCAILLGTLQQDQGIVKEIYFTKNIEESPVNFTVSSEDLLQVYKLAEQKNLEVISIFHSHPNSESFPSSTDKKFMNVNPVVWIIYSGVSEELKGFLLDSEMKEVPIIISSS